jgi:hypothetical protein
MFAGRLAFAPEELAWPHCAPGIFEYGIPHKSPNTTR